MPVQKFKTIEDADRALWCFNPDDAYFKRIAKLFKFVCSDYKPEYPKGVHKYRTFAEAQADLDKWRMEYAIKKESIELPIESNIISKRIDED